MNTPQSSNYRYTVTAIGQDSHRFTRPGEAPKPLLLGGVEILDHAGLFANSDGDVILHALTNAVSGLTGRPILGAVADQLCLSQGLTDSVRYLEVALADLQDWELLHVSFSVEARQPRLEPWRQKICRRVADLLALPEQAVCLTATSGEGLTAFGKGEGIAVTCLLTAGKK